MFLPSRFAAIFAHIMTRTGLKLGRPRHHGDLRYSVRRVKSSFDQRPEAEHQRLLVNASIKREARVARNIRNEAAQGRA